MFKWLFIISVIVLMSIIMLLLYREYSWYQLVFKKQQVFNKNKKVINTTKKYYYALEVCSLCLVMGFFMPLHFNNKDADMYPRSIMYVGPENNTLSNEVLSGTDNYFVNDSEVQKVNQIEKIKYLYNSDISYFVSMSYQDLRVDKALESNKEKVTLDQGVVEEIKNFLFNNTFEYSEKSILNADYLVEIMTSNDEVLQLLLSQSDEDVALCLMNYSECYRLVD